MVLGWCWDGAWLGGLPSRVVRGDWHGSPKPTTSTRTCVIPGRGTDYISGTLGVRVVPESWSSLPASRFLKFGVLTRCSAASYVFRMPFNSNFIPIETVWDVFELAKSLVWSLVWLFSIAPCWKLAVYEYLDRPFPKTTTTFILNQLPPQLAPTPPRQPLGR